MASQKWRILDLIRSHAYARDTRIALEHGDRAVSYRELVRRIDERARMLVGHGADGTFIALERAKSVEYVVDFLAVFAVFGTVIPIDPDTPPARRQTFLDLVRPEFLLTESALVQLDGDPERCAPDDGAFVFFTSGSTGVPKPVLGSAWALWSFVDWFGPEFGLARRDRFAFLAGSSFEASLRDLFPPLVTGATLVIPEANDSITVDWLAEKRITVVTAVPSVARGWLRDATTTCPDVRAAFFVGEPLGTDVADAWPAVFPNTSTLVNSYGSTESGQATIFNRVAPGRDCRIPAGRPVPGTRYCLIEPAATLTADLVRDRFDEPADTGEIVIVSRACSHGYLGMPEQQAARFADLGYGVKAYRTGDLGRVDEHGDLVVIGRADDEVKVNGVRVHPAEVMRAIRAHRAVADAFVVATRERDDAARLTAFVVSAAPLDALRSDLLDALPLAMIPTRFVELAELPKTRTGKVDRAALAELAAQPVPNVYVAPTGDLECWLAEQFADLLGTERVSATDDLFALGGDSITATRLASRICQRFGVALGPRDVFAAATVPALAIAIVAAQLQGVDPAEVQALLDSLESA